MRKMILNFCGIKTTKTTYIGPIRNSSDEFRSAALTRINKLGQKQQ